MAHIVLVGAETEENLALRYIQSCLEYNGHDVTIVPFNSRRDLKNVSGTIAGLNADITGLSMVFTARAGEFTELAAGIRQQGYRGHITAGGHFAAFNSAELLRDNPAIDSVAIGEGEHILCSLARNLHDPAGVDGLVYRDRDGFTVSNKPCIPPADLDTLPFPTHKDPPDTYQGMPVANILSSRGCRSSCSFCSISAWHRLCGGERLRLRDPEKIAEEIAMLYGRGYRIFNFHDDNFVLKNSDAMNARMAALSEALDARGVGRIAFAVKCRPDSVDPRAFALMKRMGLFRVFVGIEAGSEASLAALGRGHSVNDNIRALEVLNGLGLQVCFNLILLNPDSTLDDLELNLSFMKRFPLNPMNFCRAEVYAGTPLESRLRACGRLIGDYRGYDYRMADDNTQLAFELMTRILYERHHAGGNMHHASMALDYECTLRSHFHDNRGKTGGRVKRFIKDLNLDSCSRLESIISYSREHGSRRVNHEKFITQCRDSVCRADRKFRDEYSSILHELRGGKTGRRISYSYIKKIAAYMGIAAAVAAAAPACQADTHMCEMAPDYTYIGWLDDSTYTYTITSAPDTTASGMEAKRNSARKNAMTDVQIILVRNFFGIALKNEAELKLFKVEDPVGKEVLDAIRTGTPYRVVFDENYNCELVYRISRPGLREKVTRLQSRLRE